MEEPWWELGGTLEEPRWNLGLTMEKHGETSKKTWRTMKVDVQWMYHRGFSFRFSGCCSPTSTWNPPTHTLLSCFLPVLLSSCPTVLLSSCPDPCLGTLTDIFETFINPTISQWRSNSFWPNPNPNLNPNLNLYLNPNLHFFIFFLNKPSSSQIRTMFFTFIHLIIF